MKTTEQIMKLAEAYGACNSVDGLHGESKETYQACMDLNAAIEELVQERDEWKARTEFSFGERDKLAAENKTLRDALTNCEYALVNSQRVIKKHGVGFVKVCIMANDIALDLAAAALKGEAK